MRERAGITEITGFTRFELSGPKAAAFLNSLSTNRLPKVGRVGLAYFCAENGHIVTEATITRLAKDRFWFLSAAVADAHQGDPIYAGDELVGVVTSGGYGHTIGKSIALGFVPTAHSAPGTKLSISIIGQRSLATVVTEPIFDPSHKKKTASIANPVCWLQ